MTLERKHIILTALICILLSCAGTVSAKEITVGAGLGNSTITAALANATDGDTIVVTAGTYTENIIVNKSVTIHSENGAENTIVQAASVHVHIFNITSSNVTIGGFNVTGATNYSGIYLSSVSDCNISNNMVSENYAGIYLALSNNTIISNNTINSNTYGVFLDSSTNDTLSNNTMESNDFNFGVYGLELNHYLHNMDDSNLVDGNKLYYLVNQADMQVPLDAGQVYAVNSTNITVKDISISNSYEGVSFLYTNNSTIENVTVSQNDCGITLYHSEFNTIDNINVIDNYYGIYLENSTDNSLTNNTIDSNDWDGISLYSSSNHNIIDNNTISSGGCDGIYLHYSGNNTLSENTILDNPQSGINFYQSENNSALYNTITNNTYDGIHLNVSAYNILTNNDITLSGRDGINISLSNYLLVSYNVVNSNTDYGISLNQSDSNNMTNNIVNQNYDGLCLIESDNNTMSENNVTSNDYNGIYLELSNNNTLTNNNVSDSYSGVFLTYSSSNTLSYTTMSYNNYSFYVYGNSIEGYYNDIDTTNSVEGDPVYYLVNSSNMIVPSNASVVYAINSTNITVRGAEISNQPYGLIFYETDNSTIENVTVSDCFGGIILKTSSNNTLISNNVNDNFFEGIYSYESNNNTLTNNSVSNNYYGISLSQSGSNTLTSNAMSDNQYNFYISGNSTEYFYNDIAANNSVDEKPVYYLVNSSDMTVPSNAGLAYAINSTNITVSGAEISNIAWGVLFIETENSTIEDVTVSNCSYGIILDSSDNNTLTDNTAIDNYYGIYVEDSINNLLSDNIAKDNSIYDLWLTDYSHSCIINDLTVVENGAQLSFSGDYTETAIKGSATNSTALSGKTNVNGYVTIERESVPDIHDTSLSTNALRTTELSPEDMTFVHDDFLEYSGPSTTSSSFAFDSISINSAPILPLSVTFSYDDSGMSSSGESSIDLYMFNVSTWTAVNGASLDTSSNSVSVNLSEFGTFALFRNPTTTTSSSSSGTRASVSPGQDPAIVSTTASSVKRINGGSEVNYDFSDSGTPVLGVSFDAHDDEGLVVAKVQVLSSAPEGLPSTSGNSYQMMSIDVGSEGTISSDTADNIQIRFKVSKQWIEENNIDVSTIRMSRYHGEQWNDLPTYQEREEDGYVYFYAETPGFSVFNVVGDEISATTEQVPVSESATEEVEEPVEEEETSSIPGFTALAGIMFVSVAVILRRK